MLIREILDFLAPRHCTVCGRRLAATEDHVCTTCLWHLPRTGYHLDPLENELSRLFWGRFPLERAAAWFFYQAHSDASTMILDLKYQGNKQIGQWMGKVYAGEIAGSGFFEGIDLIVPVPITWWRKASRGYNQSLVISQGLSEATGIPVHASILKRHRFSGTQTRLSPIERVENVQGSFRLTSSRKCLSNLKGKHLLLVDDVITTGSTIAACAEQLARIPDIRISILSLGRTTL